MVIRRRRWRNYGDKEKKTNLQVGCSTVLLDGGVSLIILPILSMAYTRVVQPVGRMRSSAKMNAARYKIVNF